MTFACPVCRSALHGYRDKVTCTGCGAAYGRHGDVVSLVPSLDSTKHAIQAFWTGGALKRQASGERGYAALSPADIDTQLAAVEARQRDNGLLKREIEISSLGGVKTLEVGCGNGHMSALLWRRGAHVVAGDLALPRCQAASAKFAALSSLIERPHAAVQLDAERLPFPDESFDLVVSNGVLHHTADTEAAVREVYRVLRPGGRAAIMLYARHSLMYYGLFVWHGLLHGKLLRDREWLSHVTEQTDITGGRQNPVTRVYSARELREMFASFSHVRLRKDSAVLFSATRFPRLTAALRPLAPLLGFSYCIAATK